jgi:hypothetical protein
MVSSHILSKFKCIYVQFMQLDIYIYILYLSPPEQLENGFDFFFMRFEEETEVDTVFI